MGTVIVSQIIGVSFAYAALAKLATFSELVVGVQEWERVSSLSAIALAVTLIVCEIAIAASHLTVTAMAVVAPATALLLIVFLVRTAAVLKRGQEQPCLCFGANRGDRTDRTSLVRLGAMLLAELLLSWKFLVSGAAENIGGLEGQLSILSVSAPAAALIGWCFSIPAYFRARQVLEI